jgi:hypothetical protein
VREINAAICAGRSLETLRPFPSFGVSHGPVGCQINVAGDDGSFSQRIRLFLCLWRVQRLTGLRPGGDGKYAKSHCEQNIPFHSFVFLRLSRLLPLFIHILNYAAAEGIPHENFTTHKSGWQDGNED